MTNHDLQADESGGGPRGDRPKRRTIRSYLATVTKHGIALLDALTRLATARPWLPETA